MVERVYKKGLVVGIIIMFLGMTSVSSAGSLSVEKYVSTDKQITTLPEVEVTWETYIVDGKWYVTFTCDSSEGMNDIDRVEIYIDDGLLGTLSGSGPVWTFTIEWTQEIKSSTFKFVFYPLEGDTVVVIIDGSDVTPLGADVTWETYKVDGKWYVTFTCDSDEQLDRIELFINDELIGSGPEGWTLTIEWTMEIKSNIFKFVFYDLEGNSVAVIIDGSDIKSYINNQQYATLGLSSQISNEILATFPPVPKKPIPENGETDVPINKIFIRWDGEPLQNDVYIGKTNPPPLVAENLSETWYDPPFLDANTTYYWQIVAKDYAGSETPGPIWNFTTGSRINRPPNAPDMSAEKIGDGIFIIRIKITDPDGDDLDSYAVRWDTMHFIFIYEGPFENGTLIEEITGYSEGRHELKAQCADRWWQLSDWSYLYIQVSRNKATSSNMLLIRSLERFPLLQRILNLRWWNLE